MSDTVAADPIACWDTLLAQAAHVLHHPGEAGFAPRLEALADAIFAALARDPDAGVFALLHGEDAAGYAVTHALRTALVSALVAERCGWSPSARRTLVRAGLTMNIAMLDLQNVLSLQTTPLTAKQRAEIDSHPLRGREILEAANVTSEDWLRTVEQHHVTLDGRDVPQDRTNLSQLACMVHYADVYMARISPRASRVAQPVNIAARELFMKAGGADNPYAAAIIKEMGLYPPGTFVKLANGDTAVVVRKGETAAAPQVHSLISADGWVFPDSKLRDTAKGEFRITASVPRGDVMLSLDRAKLFGYATA